MHPHSKTESRFPQETALFAHRQQSRLQRGKNRVDSFQRPLKILFCVRGGNKHRFKLGGRKIDAALQHPSEVTGVSAHIAALGVHKGGHAVRCEERCDQGTDLIDADIGPMRCRRRAHFRRKLFGAVFD